jgi:hypothetical protein
MAPLFFTCPTTHHEAPTGIESCLEGNAQNQMPTLRRGA